MGWGVPIRLALLMRLNKPGDIVVIRDHINLMGANPLKGSNDFVDLTEAYSSELRNLAHQMADRQGIRLPSGVYAAYSGPSYETPAEIRALRTMGGRHGGHVHRTGSDSGQKSGDEGSRAFHDYQYGGRHEHKTAITSGRD